MPIPPPRAPRRRRDKKIAGTRPRKHDTFMPRRVVIQKYREADARPGFRTLSWEMSSLNGARMVSPLFSPSPRLLFSSLPLSFRTCSRCRRYSRKLWGNGFELSRGISRAAGKDRMEPPGDGGRTRGYIRLRRFLRSHSYPCGNDKTDGALLLKSHRVSRIRDAEIYESCHPAFSFSLPSPTLLLVLLSHRGRGMIYLERTRIIEGRDAECRRDFLTDVIVHSTMYFAR